MPKMDLVRLDREALKAARLRRFWTLDDVRRAAGICRATLYLASGGKVISLKSARAIARALRCSLRNLLAADVAEQQQVIQVNVSDAPEPSQEGQAVRGAG